jgi:uncharacterized protein (TIGR03067 family)
MKIEMLLLLVIVAVMGLAPEVDDPAQDALQKLSGTYCLIRGEEGGQAIDAELAKTAKLVLRGDEHVVTLGSETIRGRHRVNPLETPATIDATDTSGRFAGKTVKGIYKLEDGRLSVCFAPPGEPRPTDFPTQDKPGGLWHQWQRSP